MYLDLPEEIVLKGLWAPEFQAWNSRFEILTALRLPKDVIY